MGRKRKRVDSSTDAVENFGYEYEDNLTVLVKEQTTNEKDGLHHYFGELMREDVKIDRNHKYCYPCIKAHVIKRLVSNKQ